LIEIETVQSDTMGAKGKMKEGEKLMSLLEKKTLGENCEIEKERNR